MTPLFVVGCDRSGTSLLTALLESGFNLAAPFETHFIPYFSRLLFLWGDLNRRGNRQRLLTDIHDFLEIWTRRANPVRSLDVVHPITLLATREASGAILDSSRSFGELTRHLFEAYARRHDKAGWVDNSSFFEVEPLADWDRHLPGMKVIHIIRDGRDVALSWLKTWFGPVDLADAARRWRDHVAEKRAWGAAHPDRYLELRYEDLLAAPEAVMARLSVFLERPLSDTAIRPQESASARVLARDGDHPLLGRALDPANREKWKRAMSEAEQRLFEWVAAGQLAACGYEVRFSGDAERWHPVLAARVIRSRLRRLFSRRCHLDRAKALLPLAIRLGRVAGLPLTRFL